jgi:hypothetical protein
MEKIMIKSLLISTFIITSSTADAPAIIQNNCLNCHIKQKIPSELIYRRYLLKYSTNEKIKHKLFNYLKQPDKETSIMPKQFFLKFPQKEALDLNDSTLSKSIDVYLDYFDVKKKLVLP